MLLRMPCYRPLTAYRTQDGGVAFDQDGSHAVNELQLPCGRCIGCKVERARMWAIRCVHEAQLHQHNSFVTLTYDDKHLPPDESVDVRDWQTFAKRLRKRIGPFRFFHVGEYGEQNLRPHYHALIFGNDFTDDRTKHSKNDRGEWIYTSELLQETWGLGFTTVGELTYESAAYCARYSLKKINGAQAKEHYTRMDHDTGEIWNVRPEYVTMSRDRGIGADWFTKYSDEVYPADECIHQAKRFRPPRFYDNKLDQEVLETIKHDRRQRVKARRAELTPDRLQTKERLLELQAAEWKRRV